MHLRDVIEQEIAKTMKFESSDASTGIKQESFGVKQESFGVKDEQGMKDEEPDCFIERIDYTKKLPDFKLIPKEVLDCELQTNGMRINVKKGLRQDAIS